MENTLCYGDTLPMVREHVGDASVDLVYGMALKGAHKPVIAGDHAPGIMERAASRRAGSGQLKHSTRSVARG